jgi:hypothetical protein
MSLKAFHLLFVAVSAMLGVGFGAWAIADYRHSGSAGSLWWGIGSLIGTVALIGYGRWFLKKLKGVGYL